MKIRLWGLPEENEQVTEALRAAFRVVDVSDDCLPPRGDSPLRRRYIKLRPAPAPAPADADADADAEQE